MDYRAKQMLAAPVGGDSWGPWTLSSDAMFLEFSHPQPGGPALYEIDLREVEPSSDWVWGKLLDLSEKSWCYAEALGYLVLALHDIAVYGGLDRVKV
jgi:hypothetical protein